MANIKWTFPPDISARTAEIGGRSRQAQDDHQGRLVIELADSRNGDPLLRKAVAERHGEKVCREDDLREVAKSAVWANTPTAAMLPAATLLGMPLDAPAEA